MLMVQLKSMQDFYNLKKNKWDIPEPLLSDSRLNVFDHEKFLDLIIMPGLAFDKAGNRLGYGKGYYDKFLLKCFEKAKESGKPPPKTIAIGLSSNYFENIPIEPHDIKPDLIILPQ